MSCRAFCIYISFVCLLFADKIVISNQKFIILTVNKYKMFFVVLCSLYKILYVQCSICHQIQGWLGLVLIYLFHSVQFIKYEKNHDLNTKKRKLIFIEDNSKFLNSYAMLMTQLSQFILIFFYLLFSQNKSRILSIVTTNLIRKKKKLKN